MGCLLLIAGITATGHPDLWIIGWICIVAAFTWPTEDEKR